MKTTKSISKFHTTRSSSHPTQTRAIPVYLPIGQYKSRLRFRIWQFNSTWHFMIIRSREYHDILSIWPYSPTMRHFFNANNLCYLLTKPITTEQLYERDMHKNCLRIDWQELNYFVIWRNDPRALAELPSLQFDRISTNLLVLLHQLLQIVSSLTLWCASWKMGRLIRNICLRRVHCNSEVRLHHIT